MPSADFGNLHTKNEWLKVILPIWNKTCCSPTISRLSHITPKSWNVVLSSGTSDIPGCNRLQLDPESTMSIRSAPWILTTTVGVSWSRVTGTVKNYWQLLRVTYDGSCYRDSHQLQVFLMMGVSTSSFSIGAAWLSRFLRFCVPIPSLVLPGEIFIWKALFGKMSWFPTFKTKQFPFAASISRAGVLLTLLPAYV